jgi:membrane protease subunit (stomatin/prohibitin family)
MIKRLQASAVMRDPTMGAAAIVSAQADAMRAAAANQAGAMVGFAGLGMAQASGGVNPQNLYAMGQAGAPGQPGGAPAGAPGYPPPTAPGYAPAGAPGYPVNAPGYPPAAAPTYPPPTALPTGWTCECGAVNQGRFCSACGRPKPAEALLYVCDKCGWRPADPTHPPRFCPDCGDPFGPEDVQPAS